MRNGLGISMVLHLMVITIAYFGLPSLRRDVMMEVPVMIEIVDVSDVTNAAQPKEKAKKQVKTEKPKPPPEPPKPVAQKAPPPPPPPQPKPEPEVAAVPPPPEQKPKAKEKPKPEPKPEVKKKASPVLAEAKLKKKPAKKKEEDTFASVLKTVEKLKKDAPKTETKPEKKKKPEDSFEAEIARALVSKARNYDESRPVTISEIDLVRQQIAKCWSLPAGAKDAASMVIEIDVSMNSDGTVYKARVLNKGLQTDPFLRAMAESALRAVLNERCQPFRLPADKYDRWKAMKLVFNPKEMFGP